MDIDLLNFSEIARRVRISPVYCWHLMHGLRTTEKRFVQIASVLRMDVKDLKQQIEKNKVRGR